MKYSLPFFLIMFGFNQLKGQEKLIDSLSNVLKKESNIYKKIDLNLGLSRLYAFSSETKKSETHINQALNLLKKQSWDEALVTAYIFKAVNEINLGKGSDVLYDYIIKGQSVANKINSSSGKALVGYNLAEYYLIDKGNPEKSKETLLETLEDINQKKTLNKNLGNIYKNLGFVYTELDDETNAEIAYKKAINYFDDQLKNPHYIDKINGYSAVGVDNGQLNKAQVLTYISGLKLKKGDFEQAKLFAAEAATIFNKMEAYNYEAWSKSFIGTTLEEEGNSVEAIQIYQEVIAIYEKSNNTFRLIGVHLSLGNLFLNAKEYDPAFENYDNARLKSLAIKDSIYYVNSLSSLGKISNLKGDTETALNYLQLGIKINNRMNSNPNKFNLLNNLAEVYENKKQYLKALEIHKKVIQINDKYGDHKKTLNNLINLTQIYTKIAQLDSAFYYSKEALKISDKYGMLTQKINLENTLTNLYEADGKYKEALKHYKKSVLLYNQSFKKEAVALLKNEQVRQDVATIQESRLQAVLKNKQYLTLAISLATLLLISGFLFFKLRKNKKQLESKNQQLNELNNTKDKFFGIIAHDIRSPIVALDGVGEQMDYYLKNNNTDKLERLTNRVDTTAKKLNSLLDNLLKWALLQQGVIPYQPEPINILKISNSVLEMFSENANAKNIKLISLVDAEVNVYADEASLNTILRNLISNAIKFTDIGGSITLSTVQKEGHAFIKINDTGTGISAKALSDLFSINKKSKQGTSGEQGTGLGLNLVKELIELNKGKIKVSSSLGIGSEFIICLPIKV